MACHVELQVPRQVHEGAERHLMMRSKAFGAFADCIGAVRIGMELNLDVAIAATHLRPIRKLHVRSQFTAVSFTVETIPEGEHVSAVSGSIGKIGAGVLETAKILVVVVKKSEVGSHAAMRLYAVPQLIGK